MSGPARKTPSRADEAYKRYMQGQFYSPTSEAYVVERKERDTKRVEKPGRYSPPVRTTEHSEPEPKKTPRPNTRTKPKTPRPLRRTQKKTDVDYERDPVPVKRMSFLTVLIIAVFAAGTLVYVLSLAIISQKQLQVNTLQRDLKAAKENVMMLTQEAEFSYDLDEVAVYARDVLHMQRPKDYQIVKIQLPKTSYFTTYDTPTEVKEEKLTLEGIWKLFFGN